MTATLTDSERIMPATHDTIKSKRDGELPVTVERLYRACAGILTTERGSKLFISYHSIIGYMLPGREPVWSLEFDRSTSTIEHVERLRRMFGEGIVPTRAKFHEAVKNLGFTPGYDRAPYAFKW